MSLIFQPAVKKILMLKSHSMGIGDLLRSSAAWRALKDHFPNAELHLLFLSRHPGYAAEELIKTHHLLSSATFLTVREDSPHTAKARRVPHRVLSDQIQNISKRLQPDLIIDFESSGLRSTLLTRSAKAACAGITVGISQFPGRGLLYDLAADKTSGYAQRRGLTLPMDYTNRDFVALAALGIEREGRPIELELTDVAKNYADQLRLRLASGVPIVGLNIGCGTPDALSKRPNMIDLVECIGTALQKRPHCLLLSGAKFEDDVNKEFMAAYSNRWGNISHIYNLAGETNLCSLAGLIDTCDIFISTDSGPYHIAVAIKKPTLVLFTYAEVTSFHANPWCSRLINPSPDQFNLKFNELLNLDLYK
ncbi:MAG: glycosyltransferase family 9 protein [Rhodoferax sp.]|uniref:glycosyltransferase family 9 protein n=1 Tax=Rhodoferax sp. TaxID=50421 RepID=UPI003018A66F